jgi:flagellar biosynthetic protein FliQ
MTTLVNDSSMESMTQEQILDVAQMAIVTLLWVSSPLMLVALVVGLIIALFQALTSIQEMTLTFVPKIILIFVALIFLIPFMSAKMYIFGQELFNLIATKGA